MRAIFVVAILAAGAVALGQTSQPAASPPATQPAGAAAYGRPMSTEINPGRMISYSSTNQDVAAYWVTPKIAGGEQAKRPAVILVHDIYGLTDFARSQAERLARQGYTVLAPNLYSRVAGSEHGVDAQGAWVAYDKTSDQQAMQDLLNGIEFLNKEGSPTVGQPLAVVGDDMGGIYAMMLAGTDLRVTAAVNYYGRILYAETTPQRPVSPVEDLFNLQAPLLSFYGTIDPQVPAAHLRALESRLQLNPNRTYYEVIKMPQVGHGFLVPGRQGYNAAAAAEAETKTRDFLAKYLRAEPKKADE